MVKVYFYRVTCKSHLGKSRPNGPSWREKRVCGDNLRAKSVKKPVLRDEKCTFRGVKRMLKRFWVRCEQPSGCALAEPAQASRRVSTRQPRVAAPHPSAAFGWRRSVC